MHAQSSDRDRSHRDVGMSSQGSFYQHLAHFGETGKTSTKMAVKTSALKSQIPQLIPSLPEVSLWSA